MTSEEELYGFIKQGLDIYIKIQRAEWKAEVAQKIIEYDNGELTYSDLVEFTQGILNEY